MPSTPSTGDAGTAKLLLAYLLGRPAEAPNPDALDRDEWKQCQERPDSPNNFAGLRKIPFAEAVRIAWAMSEWGQETTVTVRLSPEEANAAD